MKKVEIMVLRSDADSVMRSLGFAGCVQLIAEAREIGGPGAKEQEAAELKVRLQSLARFLGMSDEGAADAGKDAPNRGLLAQRAARILEAAKPLVDEESRLLQRRLSLRQAVDELAVFSRVKVALKDVQRLSYLT
ncbi:MAG: hypothetical protein ABSG21_16205, partial [Spirochaetia bacterium]